MGGGQESRRDGASDRCSNKKGTRRWRLSMLLIGD